MHTPKIIVVYPNYETLRINHYTLKSFFIKTGECPSHGRHITTDFRIFIIDVLEFYIKRPKQGNPPQFDDEDDDDDAI